MLTPSHEIGRTLATQRSVFEVTEDGDLGLYGILIRFEKPGFASQVRMAWLPNRLASAGDCVELWTKRGTDREEIERQGRVLHIFCGFRTAFPNSFDGRSLTLIKKLDVWHNRQIDRR